MPHGLPCITVPDAKARKWAALMPPGTRFRIGLAWRSTIYRDDAGVAQSKLSRSMPLAALAPFGQLRGVELVSLQVAHGSEETGRVAGLDLTDLTAHIDDMADTAALIGRLDLVVCIDTSVAHVAACMGAPLIVLLSSDPDWRWRAGDIDSPWYPAARVFRQSVRNDWRGPVQAACGAARAQATAQKSPSLLARWFGRR